MLSFETPNEKIHVYYNMIDVSIIDEIEKLDSISDEKSTIPKWKVWYPSGAEGRDDMAFGYQKRMTDHLDKNRKNDGYAEIYWKIFNSIVEASKHYGNIHNIEIGQLAPLSISKYKSGASMGKHTDSNGSEGPQTISVVCYLNDDYEGGEIRFADQGITIKPKAGSIVIFPSKPPFFHESMPVISGWKYISPGFWNIL
jgi:Rps23 Pro-64 3,4-dihydroxylase Tpa1-like proline 4-hydroxylase